MSAFAMYRLPHAETYTRITQLDGQPAEIDDYSALSVESGFCIAPFSVSEEYPILVVKPDRVEECAFTDDVDISASLDIRVSEPDSKVEYSKVFERFHDALKQGRFRKLVLARCVKEDVGVDVNPEDLFFSACKLYPRLFVALASTEKSGTWLVATPEILLDGCGSSWHTMSLAGTMRLEGGMLDFDTPKGNGSKVEITWSTKNIQEQRYVSTYIKEHLELFTNDICEEGPTTVRAGNLVHLRSDFRFSLPPEANIGELIASLHPTPAVCGLPKQEAYSFIIDNESCPRRYYSGFMGPLNLNGDTRLYVSLRCMQIKDYSCCLYAGGGILKDSVEEQEWNETEAKLETMRRCIATKRM